MYGLMNTLCVQEGINQCLALNTKSHIKQKQKSSASSTSNLGDLSLCSKDVHNTHFTTHYMDFKVVRVCYHSGQWDERSQTCLDIQKLWYCVFVPSFMAFFSGFFPPSDETVLFLFMSPPFKAPVLLSECWWSSWAPRCCWAAELVWFLWIMK